METKIYYRVITPDTFADMNFDTLAEAEQAVVRFGECSDRGNAAYWKEQAALCKIVKVTETTEPVTL